MDVEEHGGTHRFLGLKGWVSNLMANFDQGVEGVETGIMVPTCLANLQFKLI